MDGLGLIVAPADPDPAAAAAVPAVGEGDRLSPASVRIAHLFRLSTRAGTIHPLMHLVTRYRAGLSG